MSSDVAVWAFGSRANWTTRDSSDLDLALEGSYKLKHSTLDALECAFEESDLPYKVDVVDLNRISSNFRRIIEPEMTILTTGLNIQWREVVLGDVLTLQRGFDLPKNKRVPGMYPVVASTKQVGSHEKAKVKGPGVVIGRSGSLGGAQYITTDFWPLNTTLWVKDFKGNERLFCYYLLKSLDLTIFNAGSGVPTLNRNHIYDLPIRLPPFNKQRMISHILGTLDNVIDLNHRMNKTLEAMAYALFKSWFVDFDPVRAKMDGRWVPGESLPGLPRSLYGLFPDTLVDSKLGNIPEGWEVKQFGDVIKIVGGATPSTKIKEYWDGGIHCWATPKDLSTASSPVLLDTKRKITEAGLRKISSGLLPPGTLLLSSRAPVGYLAISEMPVAINQGFIAMQPYNDMPNLFLLFWCQVFHETIINYANGSTFLEISKTSFRSIPLVMPDMAVLAAFKHVIDPAYKRIVANEYESRNLIMQRDALLPNLMSGKIKLRGYEPPVRGATQRSL